LVPLANPSLSTSPQPSATVEQQNSSSGQMPRQEAAGEIITKTQLCWGTAQSGIQKPLGRRKRMAHYFLHPFV